MTRHGEFLVANKTIGPDPQIQDGDLIIAHSGLAIRRTNAQTILTYHNWPRSERDEKMYPGAIPAASTLQKYFEAVSEKRFRRVSDTRVEITVLETGDQHQEDMNVGLYLARRLGAGKKHIFDVPSGPVWYGGRTNTDDATYDTVWTAIETGIGVLESDHEKLLGRHRGHMRRSVVLPVVDFSEQRSAALTEEDGEDFEGEQILYRKRRHRVAYNLLDLGYSLADLRDRRVIVDLSDIPPLDESLIASRKSDLSDREKQEIRDRG